MTIRSAQLSPKQSQDTLLRNALDLARSGCTEQAITALRGMLKSAPGEPQTSGILAMLLHDSGASEDALDVLREAASFPASNVLIPEIRSGILLGLGRVEAAESASREALAMDPQRPRAWVNLGLALDAQQRTDDAIAAMQSALELQPNSAPARQVLVRRLLQKKEFPSALEFALHASVLDDEIHAISVAEDFLTVGVRHQAVEFLAAVVGRYPRSYAALILIARTLHQMGRSSEALQWSERAHQLRLHDVEPIEMRAVSLIDRGDVEHGLAQFRQLLSRSDVGAETANRYLILCHYDPADSNDALFQAHLDWVNHYVRDVGTPFKPSKAADPDRALRIGWISPRFAEGPVASFFSDLLMAMDRTRHRHILVPLLPYDDAATKRLRDLADEWLPMYKLDDAQLLQTLRDAEFDIAVDLAGHSFGSRIGVLAQRVAPIQLCWLDYFNTTAIAAMDGWISDLWLTPDDSPQRYTERLLRLSSGRFCYSPPPVAPAPDRVAGGPPVFVSFNRLAKLNDGVLDTWAEILRRVPDAQLELGTGLLDDSIARSRTLERFAERGIGAERLRLRGKRTYADLLEAYRETDIALDPFPFSGCTTTCDALWMGVAVVTLPGNTFVGRQSASLLWRLGQPEWVAQDRSNYVERAVALAGHVEELRAGRRELRYNVRERLCDGVAQADEFARLFRELWVEYCTADASNSAGSQ